MGDGNLAKIRQPRVADNLDVHDGQLTWEHDAKSETVSLESIVFILETKAPSHPFVIFSLTENKPDSKAPFELVSVRASRLPTQLSSHYIFNKIPRHLQLDGGNHVEILVSTKAGSGLALSFYESVLHPLLQVVRQELGQGSSNGDTAALTDQRDHVLITETAESVPEYARSLWRRVHDQQASGEEANTATRTIVLLSGDGGVVELLNGRDEQSQDLGSNSSSSKPTPLPLVCPLPLGTGNALFHSLHKSVASTRPSTSSLVLGLQTLFQGAPADLPTFRASFSPGSHIVAPATGEGDSDDADTPLQGTTPVSHLNGAIVASYGFHASIVYESDTPAYRAHGQERFRMVAQELLRLSHPYTAQLEIRRPGASSYEAVPRSQHGYLLATLVSNLEKTFAISPQSQPLDGKLHIVHFAPLDAARTMDVMMAAYSQGGHVSLEWPDGERVWYDEVEELRVVVHEEEERWRKVCIDGTIVGIPDGGHMEVRKSEGAILRVLAPLGMPSEKQHST